MPLDWLWLQWMDGFTGEALGAIRGSPLKSLHLLECDLVDAELEALKDMPLTELDLSWCTRVTDVGLVSLRGLPLTRLNLNGVPVTREALFSFLNESTTLKNFDFHGIESVSMKDERDFWKARYLKVEGVADDDW